MDRVTALLRSASRTSQEEVLSTLWQSISYCVFGMNSIRSHSSLFCVYIYIYIVCYVLGVINANFSCLFCGNFISSVLHVFIGLFMLCMNCLFCVLISQTPHWRSVIMARGVTALHQRSESVIRECH
jgi:hypothetical protein